MMEMRMIWICWYFDGWYGNDPNLYIFWWVILQWPEFFDILWSIWRWSEFFDTLMVDMAMIRSGWYIDIDMVRILICWYIDGWYSQDPNSLILWWLIGRWSEFVDILWSTWRWSKLVDILMFDMAAAFCRTPDGIHFTRQEGNQRTGQPPAQNKYKSKFIFQDRLHSIRQGGNQRIGQQIYLISNPSQ